MQYWCQAAMWGDNESNSKLAIKLLFSRETAWARGKRKKMRVPQCSIFPLKAAPGWGQKTWSRAGQSAYWWGGCRKGSLLSMAPGTGGREEGRGRSGEKWTEWRKGYQPRPLMGRSWQKCLWMQLPKPESSTVLPPENCSAPGQASGGLPGYAWKRPQAALKDPIGSGPGTRLSSCYMF